MFINLRPGPYEITGRLVCTIRYWRVVTELYVVPMACNEAVVGFKIKVLHSVM